MDREEKLGRALCEAYGGVVETFPKTQFDFTINVDLSSGVSLYFRNWHELLFGSDDKEKQFKNLNHYLLFFDLTEHVIEFASLDELELQLTLMGRNPM